MSRRLIYCLPLTAIPFRVYLADFRAIALPKQEANCTRSPLFCKFAKPPTPSSRSLVSFLYFSCPDTHGLLFSNRLFSSLLSRVCLTGPFNFHLNAFPESPVPDAHSVTCGLDKVHQLKSYTTNLSLCCVGLSKYTFFFLPPFTPLFFTTLPPHHIISFLL